MHQNIQEKSADYFIFATLSSKYPFAAFNYHFFNFCLLAPLLLQELLACLLQLLSNICYFSITFLFLAFSCCSD